MASAKKERQRRRIWNAVAIVIGLLFLVPFIWLVLTAFAKEGTLGISFKNGLTLNNFSTVFSTANSADVGESIGRALLDSLYLSAGTTVVTTFVALLAGYPLSRFRLPGKSAALYFIVFMTGLPVIAIVIPTYDIFVAINVVNSLEWTVLFMSATSLPFAVWIAKNFIDNVPLELEEAANVDGAGTFRTLLHVTAPLCVPGAMVVAIYTFVNAWSNFFVPFILLDTPKLPASVTIYQYFGEHTILFGDLAAFSILFTAVPVALYLVLSRRVGGTALFSGALKG